LGKRRTFFVFKGLNGKKKGGKEMKALSGKAREVMDLLTKGLHTGGHRVIDNSEGAYMAVHVEKLRLTEQGALYSVAHYFEQNGDLMRDPDMEFMKIGDDYYPVYFRQDGGIALEQEAVVYGPGGKIERYHPKLQADLATFADRWMRNIKEQQKL